MTRHQNVPAAYLTLLQDNKVLLLRRYNTGYEDGNYSMIAGHVDPGETFTECVIREAMEEAGITIKSEDLRVVHVMHRDSGQTTYNERIDVFFITEHRIGTIENQEPNKCDDLSWFDLQNIPNNTIPYIKQAIRCIRDNVYYSEYGWNNK